jgi:membrane associated rhomboid family serine protease
MLNGKYILPPLRLVFLMWAFFAVENYLSVDLGFLGIYPRTLHGLIGILTGPMIHGSWMHITSNTLPLLFLGGALYYFYDKIATRVFLQCYLFTGIFVWLFGRSFYHIGASGLIYGLAFFLISFGIFRKDFKSLFISIVVVALYGGIIYGIFPSQPGVSWESHLMGAIVGVTTAFTLSKVRSVSSS